MRTFTKSYRFTVRPSTLLCFLALILTACSDSGVVVDDTTTAVVLTQVETTPIESLPAESVPVVSAPVEPTPVEPEPVEPALAEPEPAEPEPVEPAPTEPEQVEPAPVESEPIEPAPVESEPVDTTSVEPIDTNNEITSDEIEAAINAAGVFILTSSATGVWANVVDILNEDRLDNYFERQAEVLNVTNRSPRFDVGGIIGGDDITVDPPYRFIEEVGREFDVSMASQAICTAGGQILFYSSQVVTGGDRVFENCVVGENEYRGTAGSRNLRRAAIHRFPFINFQRHASNGDVQILDGENFSGNRARNNFINAETGWRNLTFSDSSDGFSLSNFSITRTAFDISNLTGPLNSEIMEVNGMTINVIEHTIVETFDGQFTVRAPFTEGAPLNVTINLAFEDIVRVARQDPLIDFPGRDPAMPFEWQTGEVNITADDGSSMRVQPLRGNTFLITLGTGETLGPFPWTGQYELEKTIRF